VTENFIHRVGRTGRAGERGVASTLFDRRQRSELFQLERALGVKMERAVLQGGQAAAARPASKSFNDNRRQLDFVPRDSGRMVRLPGEFLQAQMEG
jgi:superfamily II DNA/RNA helicase